MAPHLTAPLVMIPLLAFAVWRRVRRQFGAHVDLAAIGVVDFDAPRV